MMYYSTRFASDVSGASPRQLGYWAKTRLLRPSLNAGKGRGSRRLYTFVDLVALKTVVALREQGCSLQKLRKAVKYLRKHYPEDTDSQAISRWTLLTDGETVYMLHDRDQIMEVITRQRVLWTVAVGRLILETRDEVDALPWESVEKVRVAGHEYHLVILRDPNTDTFTAQCKELPGAIEQGDTVEQAISNGKEAVRSVLAFMAKRRGRGQDRKYVGAA